MITGSVRTISALAAGLAAVLAFAGCSDGSSAQSQDATTTTKPAGSARITQFDVPESVACAGATSVTVTVSYAVEDARSLILAVDGLQRDGVNVPSGALDVPVHCDPLPHTFVLVAKDAQDRDTVEERTLVTELGG
jgi:hypothetical protein